jgi:hypothetical protein
MTTFKAVLREQNLIKQMDTSDNLTRLKQGHDAYKLKLVEKLLEKGDRVREISL